MYKICIRGGYNNLLIVYSKRDSVACYISILHTHMLY